MPLSPLGRAFPRKPAEHRENGHDSARDAIHSGKLRNRRSICHIIFRLDYGGLENGLVNLINHLPEDHFRHTVVCLTNATDFRQRIQRRDVEIFEVHKRPGKDFPAYGRVWRILRQRRPDIVHTRNLPALDMLAPAAVAGVRSLVHSEHGLNITELDGKNRKYNLLRRLSRLVVRRYVSVSRDLATWLNAEIGIPKDSISVIYNGVDTERFQPGRATPGSLPKRFAPPDAFVIGTIGRLEPVKDQVTLAEAFVRLLDLHPEFRRFLRLVIAGDGSTRSEVEAILEHGGAIDLAWLPGFHSNTAELYRCQNVFVLPSRREGISNTILEAMASGLPVVASRVGGNPEIVDDGVTGQLVPPRDPEALAKALLRYLNEPQLAATHGQAGRDRAVARYSLRAMIQAYQRVYESI